MDAEAGAPRAFLSFIQQSDFWKQLYRSGKPAVDAAREAATAWLAAIEHNQTM